MKKRLFEKSVARSGWDEVFLTSVLDVPVEDEASAYSVFVEIAELLDSRGLAVLYDKVYGCREQMEMLLSVRRRAYRGRGVSDETPVTFVGQAPCVGGALAGVQIIAASCSSPEVRVETVVDGGRAVGRTLAAEGYRMVFLSGVSGFRPGEENCVGAQATRMFHEVRRLLVAQDCAPTDLVRTWIYLARLLDWYGEFNRVRRECFHEFGLMAAGVGKNLPASTGIQGRRYEREECFMDALAIVTDDRSRAGIAPMTSGRQSEAYDYGSAFSRGMAVALDGATRLFVSGTASINRLGGTAYHGDHQGQVVETLLDVASLLEGGDASLRDICHATVYCKSKEDSQTFERIVRHLDMQDIPFLQIYADVCRDELLFEIDSLAVTRAG